MEEKEGSPVDCKGKELSEECIVEQVRRIVQNEYASISSKMDDHLQLEESILEKVRQMMHNEHASISSKIESNKAEQSNAIESFKKIQDDTNKKLREELIEYFKNKFEPNFTHAIFEMNKSLVEKVVNGNYELKKMQIEEDTKNNEISSTVVKKKLEVWQYVLMAIFGAFGIKLIEFLMGLFK